MDNGTGDHVEVCVLESAAVRACLAGPMLARAHACARLSPGELSQVFGVRGTRADYARRLAQAGKRLTHPIVVETLARAPQKVIYAAARYLDARSQLQAASHAFVTPDRACTRKRERGGFLPATPEALAAASGSSSSSSSSSGPSSGET